MCGLQKKARARRATKKPLSERLCGFSGRTSAYWGILDAHGAYQVTGASAMRRPLKGVAACCGARIARALCRQVEL